MRLIKIGRDQSNDIVLYSAKVSSLHAEITILDNGDILLEDKGSKNGTKVNDTPVVPGNAIKVRRGDNIFMADAALPWNQVPMPDDNSAYTAIWGIGTNLQNEIHISGSTASRFHATVKRGKDGKIYIVDHSKNGTTVDGMKIAPNTPHRIKKSSAVVCGGVPVKLDTAIAWGSDNSWIVKALAAVVCALVIVGGGYAAYRLIISNEKWDAKKINARYNSTTMMLIGTYHFEVECEGLSSAYLNSIGIPTKFFYVNNGGKANLVPCGDDITASAISNVSSYTASGFFISDDGKIVTNLHVVKPWLFDGVKESVETLCREMLAQHAEVRTGTMLLTQNTSNLGLSAYISQLKVKGVSDGIMLVPQGSYFSKENAIMCHQLIAGDDPNIDVAIIQSDKQELANRHCTYVNVIDSLDATPEALEVGTPMFTIGFPHGNALQESNSGKGIQALCHGGHISQKRGEFTFTFDATSYHGASGSPIFNDKGMLIGVLTSGIEKEDINMGVQAKYLKQLLEELDKK